VGDTGDITWCTALSPYNNDLDVNSEKTANSTERDLLPLEFISLTLMHLRNQWLKWQRVARCSWQNEKGAENKSAGVYSGIRNRKSIPSTADKGSRGGSVQTRVENEFSIF